MEWMARVIRAEEAGPFNDPAMILSRNTYSRWSGWFHLQTVQVQKLQAIQLVCQGAICPGHHSIQSHVSGKGCRSEWVCAGTKLLLMVQFKLSTRTSKWSREECNLYINEETNRRRFRRWSYCAFQIRLLEMMWHFHFSDHSTKGSDLRLA